jgi:hypothetical protein
MKDLLETFELRGIGDHRMTPGTTPSSESPFTEIAKKVHGTFDLRRFSGMISLVARENGNARTGRQAR